MIGVTHHRLIGKKFGEKNLLSGAKKQITWSFQIAALLSHEKRVTRIHKWNPSFLLKGNYAKSPSFNMPHVGLCLPYCILIMNNLLFSWCFYPKHFTFHWSNRRSAHPQKRESPQQSWIPPRALTHLPKCVWKEIVPYKRSVTYWSWWLWNTYRCT